MNALCSSRRGAAPAAALAAFLALVAAPPSAAETAQDAAQSAAQSAAQGAASGPPIRVAAAEAVERSRELDGALVAFEGEAIGEPLRRGDHAWVNLLESGTALGIWIPAENLPPGLAFGSYARGGDILKVVGTLNRACPEHGGDFDIHSLNAELAARGEATPHPVRAPRLAAALGLLGLSACLGLFLREGREKAGSRGRSDGSRGRMPRRPAPRREPRDSGRNGAERGGGRGGSP